MSEVMIREGFLCPICMSDLGTVTDLQRHFEDSHSSEDKDVLNQLKGIFGKAKRKLLKKDKESGDVTSAFSGESSAPVSSSARTNAGGIDPTMWEPQELGVTRPYTDAFRRIRDARIDRFVVETNKLLIRLDKLISPDAPTEPNKRKVFEKAIVPWAPDSDVNLCTACGRKFSLTKRRHHCRLCGGIICNKCSQFLPFSYAKKLTNPAFQYEGEGFRRSSSSTSLNSMLSPEGEGNIRTCEPCRVLLERRDQQIEQRNMKPHVVQIYEKMKMYIEEAEKLLPTYLDMAEALHAGETTFNLREANGYRTKLAKLYESIDLLSKRIYTLGTDDPEPPTPTTLRLQKMVRSYASGYLQRNMMTLQALPTEEEVTKIQERKRIEVQRRIEEERHLAAERDRLRRDDQQKKSKSPEKTPNGGARMSAEKTSDNFQTTQGWKPQEIKAGNSDDPMIQQMNIIRGYVRQAKQAGKWDEVNMLEENLKDLKREYWAQQQQQTKVRENPSNGKTQQQRQIQPDGKLQQNRRNKVHEQSTTMSYNAFNDATNTLGDNDATNPFSEQYVGPHTTMRQSPSKTSLTKSETTKFSPSRGSPTKPLSSNHTSPTKPTNPFGDADDSKSGSMDSSQSSFVDDPTNPFSDNYQNQPRSDALNPFL